MNKQKIPVNVHDDYHAHVYFEQDSLLMVEKLCRKAGDLFMLKVGKVHQKPVGPHPKWSCQVTFKAHDFDQLVPWFENNRQGLSILVHGLTGDNLKDHTDNAYWLGEEVALNLAIFQS